MELSDEFYIPMALDLHPQGASPMPRSRNGEAKDDASANRRPDQDPSNADYFTVKPKSAARKAPQEPRHDASTRSDSRGDSVPQSPHMIHQDKNLDSNRKQHGSTDTSPHPVRTDSKSHKSKNDEFKLQEAPKRKKSESSPKGYLGGLDGTVSQSTAPSPLTDNKSKSAPATGNHQPLREQHTNVGPGGSTQSSQLSTPTISPPHLESQSATYPVTKRDSPKAPAPLPPSLEIPTLPKRGDSLQGSSNSVPQITRKEVSSSAARSPANGLSAGAGPSSPVPPHSRTSLESPGSAGVNGGRVISRPMESPISKSSLDFPMPPSGSAAGATTASIESFVSPRAPPPLPASTPAAGEKYGGADENGARSPGLPPYQTSGDLSMAEDMARILGHDESDKSFLKRVSNSVRHARSQSDRGSRNSKERWPKTPLNGHATGGAAGTAPASTGMGSPTAHSSPESTKGEVVRLRESLRLERQRAAERDERLSELEAAFEGKESIRQLDGELQKRRSTMVVLDTQKELVVRELEVLTEHIAAEKQSGRPLDAGRLTQAVVRDLARELRALKDSFRAPIEDLTERKRGLVDEVARLEAQKDKAMREFEQLSLKNAQLAELNNTLVHQVNELSRQQAETGGGGGKGAGHAPAGLGIYTPPPAAPAKAPHLGNVDFSALGGGPPPPAAGPGHRPSLADGLDAHDSSASAAAATAVGAGAPRMVNLRKEQPTKKTFNWKKGGHMAKGMTKGLKGAFSSGERQAPREGSLAGGYGGGPGGMIEGTPYGAMVQNEQPSTVPPPRGVPGGVGGAGVVRGDGSGAFALFGQPKGRNGVPIKGANGVARGPAPADASSKSSERDAGDVGADVMVATLFGSELAARTEFERVGIPGIVTRCIQEVELRGTLSSQFPTPFAYWIQGADTCYVQAWTAKASTASPAATRRSRPSATASRPPTTSTWPTRTSTSTP